MSSSKDLLAKVSFWLLQLTVASIALERRAVPYLISAFTLSIIVRALISAKHKTGEFPSLKTAFNKFALFSIAYYVLLIFGMLHTDNAAAGWFDLEVKFSMLLFPILFPFVSLTKKQFGSILFAYVVGCLIAFLICLSMASLYFFSSYDPSVFYYDKLSVFHHPTYFSMYLNFAIIIFYYFLIVGRENFILKSDVILIVFIILFSVFVVLLSSKMGLMTLLVIIFGGTILWFLKSRAVFPSILVFLMVSSLIYVSFKYSSTIQERIFEAVRSISDDQDAYSSTSARIAIWELSADLVKQSPIIGYGTGDVKDKLMKAYEDGGFAYLLAHKLNAHNQYVQNSVAMGLTGLMIFLISILFPLGSIRKHQNMLYGGFIFLVTANFMAESVLETQAGVVFYALFNSFLYYNSKNIEIG